MRINRSSRRFDVNLTASLEGITAHHEIRVSDLSEGGCYVDSIAEVSVGESLPIRILAPGGEWVEVETVVAHLSRGLGFGARFVNLDEQLRSTIVSMIHRANPDAAHDPEGSWRFGQLVTSGQDNMDHCIVY